MRVKKNTTVDYFFEWRVNGRWVRSASAFDSLGEHIRHFADLVCGCCPRRFIKVTRTTTTREAICNIS